MFHTLLACCLFFAGQLPAVLNILQTDALKAEDSQADHLATKHVQLVDVRRIWDKAPHNAFTDLIRFQGQWYCVFREGQNHVSPDGALRVIRSADGDAWESAAVITSPHSDLRDAKITLTPDGRLMLSGAEALHDKSKKSHQSLVWFSNDGTNWSPATEVGDPNFWLWRTTWHGHQAFSIGYACGDQKSIRLYVSEDGSSFSTLVPELLTDGYPNETSIVFEGNTAWCLLRRDQATKTGYLGRAEPPYQQWTWKDLGIQIGGPQMIQLPDGRFVAAVRLYDKTVRTALCWLDPATGSLTEFLPLPSGGDTSYAGLVWHDGLLWVSYYSSHEGKTSIYLARVRIELTENIGDQSLDQRPAQYAPVVRDIGQRRELFVDHWLIDQMTDLSHRLHHPVAASAMTEPANNMEYGTVIKDGDLFRLYTRDGRGAKHDGDEPEVTRYCESRDGIHWTKPSLGLVELDGNRDNNVILHESPYCHNFSPFLDTRPNVPSAERFKALAGTVKSGLVAFVSADGIRWSKLRNDPVITYTKEYAFDSQNVAFWSESEQKYVCYFRHFLNKELRSVCRTTSSDFLTWSEPAPLKPNFPGEHIYTTLTHPYFRAPHIYIATPTRFHPERGESTDILFMTARRDQPYDRTFREAFIRPGLDPARWGNRSNYAALNIVPTGPEEMSIYVTPFRRFTLRTDGFASIHAAADLGEFVTHPIKFEGSTLHLNYSTSAGGSIRVEVMEESGEVIPGFELEQFQTLVGDSIDEPVQWKSGKSLAEIAGRPVRLRFRMQDADLFALQFQ